jgi:hypothetical protein
MNTRLQHDAAFAMAHALLEIVQNCLRPEERRDAFEWFYETCKAGIESYDVMRDRMQHRLRPMKN